MRKKLVTPLLLASIMAFVSCEKDTQTESLNIESQEPSFALKFGPLIDDAVLDQIKTAELNLTKKGHSAKHEDGDITVVSSQFSEINAELSAQNLAITKAYVFRQGAPSIEIIDSQFELQLEQHFVPNDPRNGGDLNITYNSFPGLNVANGSIPTDAISDDAYQRWNNDNTCSFFSQTNIARVPNNGTWNSLILSLNGEDGMPVSDINVVGHLPGSLFSSFFNQEGILGVAFTFVWLDENGNPTDIDNDDFNDTALVEIWYNDGFTWTTDTNANPNAVDLASVITHEQGHSLGLGHFGLLTQTTDFNGNIRFQYYPEAVMNAFYIGGENSTLKTTDKAGYCANYADWFNF